MHPQNLKPSKKLFGRPIGRCLAGRLQPEGLVAMESSVIALKAPKAGSKLFLVGSDGAKASAWHTAQLAKLQADLPALKKLKTALESHLRKIMSAEERQAAGLDPVAELMIADVVLDDVRKIVFLNITANEMDIDEHGLVAVFEKGQWRFEDGEYVSRYLDNATNLEEGATNSSPVSLFGRWLLDEKATADLLRSQGDSAADIRMSLEVLRGSEWTISESKLVQKHPSYFYEYKVLSVVTNPGVCEITGHLPAGVEPEVWKMKIKGDRLFGKLWVMRKER